VTAPTTILFATTNAGKCREAQAILAGLPVELLTLDDWPQALAEPIEDAGSFEGNARLKALHYAKLAGGWTCADDSGIEVDALDGAPGVYSARYAGPGGDAAANNAKLVRALAGIPREARTARFCCAVVLADPTKVLATAFGVLAGLIVDEPRGGHGFGYDPHFFVPDHGMTTAEMPPELKNRISHRGKALRAIRPQIKRLLAASVG